MGLHRTEHESYDVVVSDRDFRVHEAADGDNISIEAAFFGVSGTFRNGEYTLEGGDVTSVDAALIALAAFDIAQDIRAARDLRPQRSIFRSIGNTLRGRWDVKVGTEILTVSPTLATCLVLGQSSLLNTKKLMDAMEFPNEHRIVLPSHDFEWGGLTINVSPMPELGTTNGLKTYRVQPGRWDTLG